jgi:hypothetical protein
MMNPSSQWRTAIAEQIAPLYASNPKVAAVMLGGSSARGHADQYSDMEIGVFWQHAPSDDDRRQVIEAAGADLNYLYEYDASESVWSDDFFIGRDAADQPKSGLYVEIVHYTAAFMEQTLNRVLNDYASDAIAHNLVGGVVDGIPLVGAPLLEGWKKRAAVYPRELSLAVVRNYGVIDHFWRWEMYLARSENLMLLYQSFAQVEQRLLHILLGLNRVYYFGFKWLDVVADRLPLKPDHLLDRLRQVYKVPPEEGARLLTALVEDTFALVETHLPEVDVKWLREVFHYRRPFWSHSPFDTPET